MYHRDFSRLSFLPFLIGNAFTSQMSANSSYYIQFSRKNNNNKICLLVFMKGHDFERERKKPVHRWMSAHDDEITDWLCKWYAGPTWINRMWWADRLLTTKKKQKKKIEDPMTVTYPRSFGAKFHLVILVVIIGRFVSSSWSGWRFDEYDVTLRRAHHNITLTIVKIRFRIEHQQFRLVRNSFDSLHNLLV